MESGNEKTKAILREIRAWVISISAALFLGYFVNTFVIAHATVPTASMNNTVMAGNHILANRLAYVFSDPARFDVVAFSCPDGGDTMYLKRIIGLPGEVLEIRNGNVYINESAVPIYEWYLLEPPAGWSLINQRFYIPYGSYFVMGDHRNNSKDSRGLGANAWENSFIPRENILGRVFFTFFSQAGRVR